MKPTSDMTTVGIDDPLSLTAVFANGKLIVLKSTHESATREGVA